MKELKHLIKYRKFTLHTDHKNLVKISEAGSDKVRAWKMAIAHYNFDIQYIQGEENVAADAFARLCTLTSHNHITYADEVPRVLSRMCAIQSHVRIPKGLYKLISSKHNCNVGHVGYQKLFERV